MNKEPTFKIEAQSFFDAAVAIQAGLLNGYVIDVNDPRCYPQQFGHYFFLTMVLPEPEPVAVPVVESMVVTSAEEAVATVEKVKRTRKAKEEDTPVEDKPSATE